MDDSAQFNPVERYLPLLVEGRYDDLHALFSGEPDIDDPIEGHAAGHEAVRDFLAKKYAWLLQTGANVDHVRLTQGLNRSVEEAVLNLALQGKLVALPVAVVGEHSGLGQVSSIRVYHSMWPLIGSHKVRPSILPEDSDLKLTDVIDKYQHALAKGNLEDMLELFESDGYAREPSGGEYVYRGKNRLREIYGGLFAVGGFPLQHCTVTDDGICCAIEYNVVKWGRKKLPSQAGVAVYERGPGDKLAAARIYDDVAIEEGGEENVKSDE